MSLQGIINTAVNIEVNRSKLAAQSISRSGRILTAARNWANPYRMTVTPRPIWRLDDTITIRDTSTSVRAMIEAIYAADRITSTTIFLADINGTTGALTAAGMEWLVDYQGEYGNTNGILTSVTGNSAGDAASGNRMFITLGGTPPATDTYIVKRGDWIRPTTSAVIYRYPYQVTADIVVPPSASSITGTITSTATETTITSVSSTTNLRVGQKITETGTNTGSFGGSTFITAISGTTVSIQSTTANTAGAITFSGSATEVAIPIHRGFLPQTGYSYGGTNAILVGYRAARMNVLVTKLPSIRYLPGKYVEFNGDFELVEEILGT
jgi:hypothetical protein